MFCLTLACCRCDRIPALLFSRPHSTQRRWNIKGEIEEAAVPTEAAIPQWSNGVVIEIELNGDPDKVKEGGVFDELALGAPGRGFRPRLFALAPEIKALYLQKVITAQLHEEFLVFELETASKDSIWCQTSEEGRLLLCLDLLKLTIFAFPDLYSESLWQTIQRQCQNVIESTILPLLSVVGWMELKHHQAM